MPTGTKIATCCYCGTRAALVLSGTVQHELACASCGAPLHDLKMLRADAVARAAPGHQRAAAEAARPRSVATPGAAPRALWERETRKPKKKSKKRRKSTASRLFREAFDVLEDIFD